MYREASSVRNSMKFRTYFTGRHESVDRKTERV